MKIVSELSQVDIWGKNVPGRGIGYAEALGQRIPRTLNAIVRTSALL